MGYSLKSAIADRKKKRLSILCVESDEFMLYVLETVLKYHGHWVESVKDGRAAFWHVTQDLRRFDLIITAKKLPDFSSLELITKLREVGFPGKLIVLGPQFSRLETGAFSRLAAHTNIAIVVPEWPALLVEINRTEKLHDR